ncbi:MAG: hypothetical protein OK441_01960 [Thaumarchaeota archaeon]|nr:hypothetical protein [Nitrososphaerota archaeon]
MNSVILECPRCQNMFMASTLKSRRVGEKLWGTRCKCGNIIEFDFDYLDPVELWAQPNVANRMREIDGYAVRVEGLTYAKGR